MGFKRIVTLCCDGPCGTALPEKEKAPSGWTKLMLTRYEILAPNEKPKHKPITGWYCDKCTVKLISALEYNHFSLNHAEEQSNA